MKGEKAADYIEIIKELTGSSIYKYTLSKSTVAEMAQYRSGWTLFSSWSTGVNEKYKSKTE